MYSANSSSVRAGFVVRNEFQAAQLAPFARALGGCFLCDRSLFPELRKRYPDLNCKDLAKGVCCGGFEVLVSHGPFRGIDRPGNARVAMLQYGYAKSRYNYGDWRALADLNLVYGPHAAEAIRQYSPVRMVGHPLQSVVDSQETQKAKAEQHGKLRVLYAPTWGALSSITAWAEEIGSLSPEFVVTLKPHHNTLAREPKLIKILAASGVELAPARASLMDMILGSDVVISDYSGAIFDAVLAEKPVVLVDGDADKVAAERKIDSQSLEIAYREDIGLVARHGALRQAVLNAAAGHAPVRISRAELFATVEDPIAEVVRALHDLATGRIVASSTQRAAQVASRAKWRRKRLRVISVIVLAVAISAAGLALTV